MDAQRAMNGRTVSVEESALIAEINEMGTEVGHLIGKLRAMEGRVDQRWISIGTTELQKGFMFLTRGVAQPKQF